MDTSERLLDLDAEFNAARAAVRDRHLRWIKGQHVPAEAWFVQEYYDLPAIGERIFADPRLAVEAPWPGLTFGILDIEVIRAGKGEPDVFVPTEGGREAMVVPCENDLVAFFPNAPRYVYRRCNHNDLLGDRVLESALQGGEPLHVHETVLDLMRANWNGVCVLDYRNIRGRFDGVPELRVENAHFGRWLEGALTRPYPCPPIKAPVE